MQTLPSIPHLPRFVLFMLPKLTSLDTLLLADETKLLAEATFLKKQARQRRAEAGRGEEGKLGMEDQGEWIEMVPAFASH